MPIGRWLLDEGPGESGFAFENQRMQRPALQLGRRVRVRRSVRVEVAFPPVVGRRAQQPLEIAAAEAGVTAPGVPGYLVS
jgi:hypothetical protein